MPPHLADCYIRAFRSEFYKTFYTYMTTFCKPLNPPGGTNGGTKPSLRVI